MTYKETKLANTRLIKDKDSPDLEPLCSRYIDCGKQRLSMNAVFPRGAFWKFIETFLFSKVFELYIILLLIIFF